MLNESLPLTIHEYPEWGNPSEDVDVFNAMKAYDPYLNIRTDVAYPSTYGKFLWLSDRES
jgi:oligopeptidase B